MILVAMKTLPYIMVPNNYTLGVSISNSQGVHPPQEDVLQKRAQEDEGWKVLTFHSQCHILEYCFSITLSFTCVDTCITEI